MRRQRIVIIGFLFLTFLSTYPLIFKLKTHIYHPPPPVYPIEPYYSLWWIWLLRESFLEVFTSGIISVAASPFGVNLSEQQLMPTINLIGKTFAILVDEVFSYNMFLLMSYVLSGFLMYILAYRLTKNSLGSFIAGTIYSFSSYHHITGMAYVTSEMNIQWMPLYILSLFNIYYNPGLIHVLIYIISFLLIISFSFYHLLFMLIFTIVFLLCHFIFVFLRKVSINWRFLKYLILAVILSINS